MMEPEGVFGHGVMEDPAVYRSNGVADSCCRVISKKHL